MGEHGREGRLPRRRVDVVVQEGLDVPPEALRPLDVAEQLRLYRVEVTLGDGLARAGRGR